MLPFVSASIAPARRVLRLQQPDMDALLLCVTDQFLQALLASDPGLLVTAKRGSGKMPPDVIHPDVTASTAEAVRCAVARSLVQIEQIRPSSLVTAFSQSFVRIGSRRDPDGRLPGTAAPTLDTQGQER